MLLIFRNLREKQKSRQSLEASLQFRVKANHKMPTANYLVIIIIFYRTKWWKKWRQRSVMTCTKWCLKTLSEIKMLKLCTISIKSKSNVKLYQNCYMWDWFVFKKVKFRPSPFFRLIFFMSIHIYKCTDYLTCSTDIY